MATELLQKLERKVAHAVEVIELLRLQIDELEEENAALKAEQEKWRDDLAALLTRFDDIEVSVEKQSSADDIIAEADDEFEYEEDYEEGEEEDEDEDELEYDAEYEEDDEDEDEEEDEDEYDIEDEYEEETADRLVS